MANPDPLFAGTADPVQIDPIFGPDGTVYLKAAGDSMGIPTGASDPSAPQMVQIAGFPSSQHLAVPTGLALVQGTGTLAAATYYYRVSAISASGETVPCGEVSLAISATTGVVLTWNAVSGATGYRVYGRSTGAELFIAEVTAPTVTFTDSGAITPTGAMPTVNTARFALGTEPVKAATGTLANVSGSASSVTLQAANTARKGLTIWNDSAAILYVKCAAAAASATSCTVKLVADAYWELPFQYSGEVRGIWASATGSARLTEFS